ncbi:immunoglobulin superfamily member 23 [Phacochoerus africanus]|uniref:immunoglobulin superfamily member 23 n=1 Tax=Phacochoerus africanus TaxID=41426 RepID=UPI001FD8B26A|nr:immunoglobulin superfamily member 23 [Phacochoerus africanus]
MIFSPKGFPGPGHTGRETLDPQGSLIIRNVTTQDAGSYTVVLETSRGRRSATEQIHVKASSSGVPLMTFPGNSQGIIQSELNYSVILQWVASIDPEPVLRWTLNGSLCGTGKKMIIQRLSLKDLGTYVCLAENSEEVYFSQPVTVMLPRIIHPQLLSTCYVTGSCWAVLRTSGDRDSPGLPSWDSQSSRGQSTNKANVEPTDPVPIKPNPTLSLSGGSAIALIVVTLVVIVSLVVLSVYTLIHDKRSD